MDIEYIKVGKWYNVPFKVVDIKSGDIHMENGGITAVCQPSELSEITARQDVRTEHSTVGTLSSAERWGKLWDSMHDVLFGNVIKNTETAPKYDPNRIFRKGDKVKPRERNGRIPWAKDTTLTVISDERNSGVTVRDEETEEERLMCVLFLELVTPVEELEPYFIEKSHDGATIVLTVRCVPNGEGIAFRYCPGWGGNVFHSEEQFRQHAEAERDRLNAEYRKEQSNGLGH